MITVLIMTFLLKVPLFNPVEHIVDADIIIEASCLRSHETEGIVFEKIRCLKGTMLDMKGELMITNGAIRRLRPICLVFDDLRDWPQKGTTYQLFLYNDRCYYGHENSEVIASIVRILNVPEEQKLAAYQQIIAKGEPRTIELLARFVLDQLEEKKLKRNLGVPILVKIIETGIDLEAGYGEDRVYTRLYKLNEASIAESIDKFQKGNISLIKNYNSIGEPK